MKTKHLLVLSVPANLLLCTYYSATKWLLTVIVLTLAKVVTEGKCFIRKFSCISFPMFRVFRFSTGVLLSAHIKEQCLCDTCGEVVCNTAAFQRHLLRHKNCLAESKELRTCDICQKVSTSQQDMLAHKLCAHNPLRTYECNTSSVHDNFPFQYPYAITSQENASTMLAYPNHPYSVNRRWMNQVVESRKLRKIKSSNSLFSTTLLN